MLFLTSAQLPLRTRSGSHTGTSHKYIIQISSPVTSSGPGQLRSFQQSKMHTRSVETSCRSGKSQSCSFGVALTKFLPTGRSCWTWRSAACMMSMGKRACKQGYKSVPMFKRRKICPLSGNASSPYRSDMLRKFAHYLHCMSWRQSCSQCVTYPEDWSVR